MKTTLYLVLIAIILGLGYLRLSTSSIPPAELASPSPMASPSPSPSAAITLDSKLNTAYFSLAYSSLASLRENSGPDSQEWGIYYMGEEQRASGRTQTELWDGYAITLTRFESVGEDQVETQARADRQGIIDACGEEFVTDLTQTFVADYQATTFFGGCLGEADHYYLAPTGELYRLTVMVVGSEAYKPAYLETVSATLNSLMIK